MLTKNFLMAALLGLLPLFMVGQTNFVVTNPKAEQILLGNYNAADYAQANPVSDPLKVVQSISNAVSADSLKSWLLEMSSFSTRHTASDTVSATTGIGAARRWAYRKFESFSKQQENRLLVSYFQFDQAICNVGQHRNIFAVLPGTNPTENGVVLIEGHIDSRCAGSCDVTCVAQGMEDNGSGSALVLELARVMSGYSYPQTLVFMLTIGEEQGLYGAAAFAQYIVNKNIPLRAVLNNDIVGGVICGETSSPPSCPGLNNIDSTGVRLFSSGGFNSKNKQLARFTKLQYKENLRASATVPMDIRIMSPEDRTGRGGDHIPFRERGFPALRFCSANEHGDASNGPDYHDRQHTSNDILGVDTNNDGSLDSFFVQFNYLARNAILNANAAAMIAQGVPAPTAYTATRSGNQLTVNITGAAGAYRVALRSTGNDWDTVYTIPNGTGGTFTMPVNGIVYVSVAAQNTNGVESLFSGEKLLTTTSAHGPEESSARFRLLPNRPNPFDEATWIGCWVPDRMPTYSEAVIQVTDASGKILARLPVTLKPGLNEVLYRHGYGQRASLTCSLLLDGRVMDSRQMIFAN